MDLEKLRALKEQLADAALNLDDILRQEEVRASQPLPAPYKPSPLVVIDAGHGGKDPGAVSPNGTAEKDVVLGYAVNIEDLLEFNGSRVVMTRTTDVFVPLSERANKANAAGAACFVSIHANAADSKLARGAWVIHDDDADPAGGKDLANRIFDGLKEAGLGDEDALREVFPDGSPQVGNRQLAVLGQTKMPAVIVELGFVTNEDDLSKLMNGDVRNAACTAIADAIMDWLAER